MLFIIFCTVAVNLSAYMYFMRASVVAKSDAAVATSQTTPFFSKVLVMGMAGCALVAAMSMANKKFFPGTAYDPYDP